MEGTFYEFGELPPDKESRRAELPECVKRGMTAMGIISGLPLEEQYVSTRKSSPRLWRSLLRKIDKVVQLTENGEVKEPKGHIRTRL